MYVDKENWLRCDACMHWFHLGCIKLRNNTHAELQSDANIEWKCNKCGFDGMIVIYINILTFFFPDMLYIYRKW